MKERCANPASDVGRLRQMQVPGYRATVDAFNGAQSALRPVEPGPGHDVGELADLRPGDRHLARVTGQFAHADPIQAGERGRAARRLVRPVQCGRQSTGFRTSTGRGPGRSPRPSATEPATSRSIYLANSKAAPNGLTVAISASAPAYLQEAIADFSGVATTALLDQAVRKRITARSGSPWARLEGCLLNLGRAATGGLRSRV